MTTTNYGIPSETELENLAGYLFPDFEPEVCASGLEGLAAGDTSILNCAASKAASYGGGVNYASSAENAFSGYGSISEFEQIANEYNGGYGNVSEYEKAAEGYGSSSLSGAAAEAASYDAYTFLQNSRHPADTLLLFFHRVRQILTFRSRLPVRWQRKCRSQGKTAVS